ncbi:hypothetical protein EV182_005513, partial [Spiromyces aspiralis]
MFFRFHKDNATVQTMNMMGYDAMTLGNHEFDKGPSLVATFIPKLNFPVVSSNIDAQGIPDLHKWLQPYVIIDRHNIAIIGIITTDLPTLSPIGPNIKLLDPVPVLNSLITELKGQGINRIIVLSHSGYFEDVKIAEQLHPGISLIIGGHSHTYLSPEVKPEQRKGDVGQYPTIITNHRDPTWKTYIVQAKVWGEYLGYLDLVFDTNGMLSDLTHGFPIHVTNDIPEDKEMRE